IEAEIHENLEIAGRVRVAGGGQQTKVTYSEKVALEAEKRGKLKTAKQLKALGVPVQKFVATTGFSIKGTAKKSLQSGGKAGQMINCLSCLGSKRRAYYAGG
ncbi:MAG: hypothetical protein LBT14_04220, partial [Treponema sp.]|nr:hypothetical protein [Treponema sp.]